MNILYFHQYFCTPEGNSGIRSYEMAKYLVSKGHKVTMVFGESPRLKSPLQGEPFINGVRRGTYENINLIEFNLAYNNKMSMLKRSLIFVRFGLRSIRLVYTENYDLLFATSTPITAGIPGIVMKLLGKKKPFVFEVRDLWPELPRAMGVIKNKFVLGGMSVLEYLSYNKSDACVALSPGIEEGIKRRLKKNNPVFFIPNGCDLEIFKPGTYKKDIFPGCNDDNFVAIFMGAHGIANGLDAVLDAASEMKQDSKFKHIRIALIGDGKMKPHLGQRVENEGLDNVMMLSSVPKKEIIKYLWAADAGLMILANVPEFYYGTSPNKFFDYVSSGLPVLNNYPGWLAGMIEENNLGTVVKPDDPVDFANGLLKLSEDKDKLKQMSENAREFAKTHFDRFKYASVFEESLVKVHQTYNEKR
ncbi:glycosyltransferase family 4 protein [Labilibacter sediminis]|nr:glycosyltransferase family 4 protein [Labilibacter sediminis]